MSTICRGYIRVSTEEQRDEGYSLDAQASSIRSAARERGWLLADIYADEGISAKDMHRPQLLRLLRDLQRNEVLMVYKLDRLSRSVLDAETIFRDLDKRQATFHSVAEPHLSTAGSAGVMVRQITAVFAEHFRRQLGESVRHGMTQMVRQGRWSGGMVPYGYDYVDQQLRPNPQTAPIAKRIFAEYLSGAGIRAIAAGLNRDGYLTGNGSIWSTYTISYIIRNPIYAGKLGYGKKTGGQRTYKKMLVADGHHEPVIDEATWRQAQEVMERRKTVAPRHATGDYPLTGIAKCALCGASLNGARMNNGKGYRKRYYRCDRKSRAKACTLPAMQADRLEEQFITEVERWLDPDVVQVMIARHAAPADSENSVDVLQKQITELDRRIARWDEAFEAGAKSLAEFTAKVKPLQLQRQQLISELGRHKRATDSKNPHPIMEAARMIRQLWQDATHPEQKELVHRFAERVTIGPGYVVEVVPKLASL